MKDKFLKFIKKYYPFILSIFFLIIFSVIAYSVKTHDHLLIDEIIYNFINKCNNSFMTMFFFIITFLASKEFIILISLIFILISLLKRKYLNTTLIITNLIICIIFNQVLKELFVRQRPFHLMIINESGYSFPSGHSITAMIFYGYFIYMIWQSNKEKSFKIIFTIINSLLILLIGISRIYLGVHYPTDVLGAYMLGIAYLIIYIKFTKKYFIKETI